jgi:hypothetical protein
MRDFIIFGLIFLGLALNCLATEPFHIGKDNGMAILNSLADNASNTSNATNISSGQTNNTDLWSWGEIPLGYKRNDSGTLERQPSQEEWVPSI